MAGTTINTFDKGLHQDSTFILQPDGTYRNMKNGMLISYDGNHYVVEMTKGNRVLLTLIPRYLANTSTLDIEPMPIGFISFIDKLVVFSTNSESTTGYGEIGVITFVRVNLDFVGTYVPYYHHASLNFTKLHKIEGFSFRENDNVQRVYWTDNFNEPRVFDIANTIFTTYFTGAADLIANDTYMVLKGAVTYNGIKYGVGLTAGNIFTASAGTSYTLPVGAPLVIEYYPLPLLNWTPSRLLGSIDFKEYGTGNKYCGDSIYFYRLSSSFDGAVTSWSYASNPIHVGMNNTTTYLTGTPYRDFVGNGSDTTLVNSGKSVKLTVSNIDTNFDTIELCCAEFNQINDVPYRIIITNKVKVTSSSMTIEDTGASNLGVVTISELTLFPASVLKCKTISTNKNYSIIANLTERQEFTLDLSGVTLTQFEYPLISHGDLSSCSNANVPLDQSPTAGVNPGAGDIKPWSRYLVSLAPDASNRVEYPVASSTYYYTGDVFVGVVGSATATFTGTAQARPCTTRNQYTKINSSAFSGDRVEDAIELKTAFWDYKDPAVASHNKCYWSTEKYRLAFVGFDTKGNPFYSKFINDFTFSTIPAKGGLMRLDSYSGADQYSLNPSAINLSGLDIPESVMNQLSGFSIMRAERDPIVITQGLLMQNIINTDVSPSRITPLGIVRTSYSVYPTYQVGDGYYINSVICPDNEVGYNFPSAIGVTDQKMKEACWFDGQQFKTDSNFHAMYTKLFTDSGTDAASPRTMVLKSMNGAGSHAFNVADFLLNFDGTGRTYTNNYCDVYTPNVTTFVDATCAGGTYPSPDNILSVGCKKIIVKTQFPHFGNVADYNTWDTPPDPSNTQLIWNKILANFLTNTDPANQYGGVSESAIANTLYMSTGHFQPINANVKADTLNGTFSTGIYSGENKYTFNNVEIFGGDCFTNLIDIGYGLWDDDFNTASNAMGYSIWFPCEGNANYGLRRGLKVSNKNMYPLGLMGWNTPGGVQLEGYSYNKGYSTDGTFIKYPALPLNYKFTGKFDYRMRWSEFKTPGELIDSFRTFRIPDYRDIDGQRGQINNLKARDSKLFYWQDHSVGYTPILERQLVGGSALGDATALGVTGVIDRYDDIDTFFGNQHQHGLTDTEYGFAWFDMRRRAFMVMGIGSKPEEMSMVKGLQVYFNNEFNEGSNNTSDKIYNTNNLNIAEKPLLGFGIVGCYDPTFKMTYLTFKFEDNDSRTSRDFTLGYNHILNAFVSFVDNCPAIWHNHNDLVLTSNNPKLTNIYAMGMPPISYVISDTIRVVNTEYICINPVTIASYPGTLTNGGTSPLALGASGGANDFWLAINKTNQIYLQNFGADLCKFYGKIWEHSIEAIVNFKTDIAVTPQNIQFKGNTVNFTDIYCSTDDQTSQDLNISATNRFYRWIDKAWFISLPLPSNGRLTDYYVKVKFVFKNYVTNPTVSKNVQKLSQWFNTFWVYKK